jgi:hypothetical protein
VHYGDEQHFVDEAASGFVLEGRGMRSMGRRVANSLRQSSLAKPFDKVLAVSGILERLSHRGLDKRSVRAQSTAFGELSAGFGRPQVQ